MTTEELNEYLFAKLVHDFAHIALEHRTNKINQSADDDFRYPQLSRQDIQKGVQLLEWFRVEGQKALSNTRGLFHEESE